MATPAEARESKASEDAAINPAAATGAGTTSKAMDTSYDDRLSPPGVFRHDHEMSVNKTPTGLFSEHGHTLAHVRPMAKHPGSSVSTFFNGVFTTIIGISTLGASITFSYVLSNNTSEPRSRNPAFGVGQIQQFLAISWLLFLLALAFASLGSTLLTFFKDHWVADWDGLNGRTSQWSVQMYAVCTSGLLGGLIVGAFVLLCLVVVAYVDLVGWVALGFTTFFGLVIALAVINQAPWPWRDNTPSPAVTHRISREP